MKRLLIILALLLLIPITSSKAATTYVPFTTTSFVPTNLPNLVLWAKKNTGLTGAPSAITAWADQSGAGHDLITQSTSKPTLDADNTVKFVAGISNQWMQAAFTSSTPRTVCMRVLNATWVTDRNIWDGVIMNSDTFEDYPTAAPNMVYGTATNYMSFTMSVGDWHSVCGIHNGTSSVVRIDGTKFTTAVNVETGPTGGINLMNGGNFSGSPQGYSNGKVAEVLIYSDVKSDSDLDKIIAYLDTLGGAAW